MLYTEVNLRLPHIQAKSRLVQVLGYRFNDEGPNKRQCWDEDPPNDPKPPLLHCVVCVPAKIVPHPRKLCLVPTVSPGYYSKVMIKSIYLDSRLHISQFASPF